MMNLIMAIELVKDATLRRVSWLRWSLETVKEKRALYQCSDCNRLVTAYNDHPVTCGCEPCRVCGELASSKKHLTPFVPQAYTPMAGSIWQLQNYAQNYNYVQPVVTKSAKKPVATHYFAIERRKSKRR